MKKFIIAAAAGLMALSTAACNTPGERAIGGAAIGGLAGAAIGGVATGRTSGALAGAAIGAAGGAVVGAATAPEPKYVEEPAPPMAHSRPVAQPRPARAGANPGSRRTGTQNCPNGTYVHHGSIVCSP